MSVLVIVDLLQIGVVLDEQERQQLVVMVLGADDWEHVKPLLAKDSDAEIKVNVGRQRFPNVRTRRLCILVRDAKIVGLCLARYLSKSGDVDFMAGIEYLRKMQPAVSVDSFCREVRHDLRDLVAMNIGEGAALSQAESVEVEAVLRNDLVRASVVDFLLARLDEVPDMSTHAARVRAEQRDAVALALEVAGFASRHVLSPADLALTADVETEPYLAGLPDERSGERAIIRHDWHSLDGWLLQAAHKDRVTFADPSTGSAKITVTYADGADLELITGTDLIYRRTSEPGYVLVQYKQMRHEGSGNVYRPDDQLRKEIERMRQYSSDGQTWLGSLHDYRLSAEPFYMKIVDPTVHRAENRKLADGMYFPLSLFEMMLADDSFRGPKDGWRITERNAPKHLRNDLFIQMLQGGWIGTVGRTTEDMTRMIQQRLAEKRGVVLAEHHAEPRATQRARHWIDGPTFEPDRV